jgi:hypothetical protein
MSIKNLLIQECANWLRNGPFRTQNYCWANEKSNGGLCLLLSNPPKPCKYFEEYVLPLAEDMAEEYSRIIAEGKNGESEGLESADIGAGAGQSAGPSQVIHVSASPRGLPVGKHIKKTLLSRHALHGVGTEKEAPESGRDTGNR